MSRYGNKRETSQSLISKKIDLITDISEFANGGNPTKLFELIKQKNDLVEDIFSFMEMDKDQLMAAFLEKDKEWQGVISVLPDKPDYDKIDLLLKSIRKEYLK